MTEPVSMLITTNGRADLLRRSLVRLVELTVPDQIVLVDDGTPDDSVRAAAEWCLSFRPKPLPVTYVRNENPGMTNCCHARNVGLRECLHAEVITTEPELWFVTDVVAQLAEARAARPGDVLAASKCYHAPDEACTMNLDACDDVPAWPYVNAWRRSWLEEVGGWDEDLPGPWGWDDIDLLGRVKHNGHPQRMVPGVEVHHQWHKSRIEPAVENEAHARAKIFPRDLVANAGRQRGRIKS